MVSSDLPEDVKRLLREHIYSVEQLEILLFLRSNPEEAFDARAVHDQLRTSETSAAARLLDLSERGFLQALTTQQGTSFRYAPNTDWLAATTDRLAHAYAERRYRVMELVFSKPIENLRVFADAFRFRKDKSDG